MNLNKKVQQVLFLVLSQGGEPQMVQFHPDVSQANNFFSLHLIEYNIKDCLHINK